MRPFAESLWQLVVLTVQSRAESEWTESYAVKITRDGKTYTDAHESLSVLEKYIEEHSSIYATADHVALFTGSVYNQSINQSIDLFIEITRHTTVAR